jgi:hypothetical protein
MSEPLLPREVRRRLAIIQHAEEVTGNVAMTCRYTGLSTGLLPVVAPLPGAGRPRVAGGVSWRPRHSPNATHVDVVGKNSLSTPELPFRAGQDRNVSQAVSRR